MQIGREGEEKQNAKATNEANSERQRTNIRSKTAHREEQQIKLKKRNRAEEEEGAGKKQQSREEANKKK